MPILICYSGEITLRAVWRQPESGSRLDVMSRTQSAQVASVEEIEGYSRKLKAALAGLASSCCDLTPDRDGGDQLTLDSDRNLMLDRLEWISLLTRQVSEALERIDNCGYGLCLRCGQPIARKRLAALPWVAFCMACQEKVAEIRVA